MAPRIRVEATERTTMAGNITTFIPTPSDEDQHITVILEENPRFSYTELATYFGIAFGLAFFAVRMFRNYVYPAYEIARDDIVRRRRARRSLPDEIPLRDARNGRREERNDEVREEAV